MIDNTVWDNRATLINLKEKDDGTNQTAWIRTALHQLQAAQKRTLEDWMGPDEDDDPEDHHPDANFLGVRYIIDYEGDYLSVILTDAYGGPNCYLRTDDKEYHLYWGGEHYSVPISLDICEKIDEYFEEYYNSTVKASTIPY